MAIKDLESRLRAIPANVNSQFISAARSPKINPKEMWQQMPYLKLDLVNAITGNLKARGLEMGGFGRELYSSQLNKDPLKRVHYGMLTARNVPADVLKALDSKFEPLYLYSGIWHGAEVSEDNPVCLNVAAALYSGLNCMYENHYKSKAKGKYSRDILLPRGHEIRDVFHKLKAEQGKILLQVSEKNPAQKKAESSEEQSYLF